LVLVGGDNGSTVTAIQVDGDGYTKAILQSNTGVDIGDVDVASIVPGTGATNLGKAEDAAHANGDTGVMALAVRDDNLAAFSAAEGDYEPLHTDGSGRLYVTMDEVVVGSQVQVDVVAALPAGTNAIGKLAAGDANIGNVDIVTLPAANLGQQAMAASLSTVPASNITDATYIGDIKFGEALPTGANTIGAVTGTGTFVVQENGAALAALQLIDDAVYVDDADWTDNTSKHLLVGGVYESSPQTITDGDTGPLEVDANGYLKVSLAANPVGVAGSTAYTEDVASANPIVGTATMMERDDQLGTLTPVEGDWTSLRSTSKGALWVSLADASGDPITSFGGGQEYVVNAAAPTDPTGKAIVVERDDALTTVTETEGDWSNLRGTAEGALWVQDFNSDAILAALVGSLDVSGATVTVDLGANNDVTVTGTVTANPTSGTIDTVTNVATIGTSVTPGTGSAHLGKAEDAVHGSGDTGVMALAVRNDSDAALAAAGDYTPLQTDDTRGALKVEIFDGGDTHTIQGATTDNGPSFTPIYKYLAKSTTADATLWNPSDNYLHITDVIISISGTATDVTLGFGSGTSLEETILKFHGDVRGGLTHHFRAPLKSTDSGDNLNIALSAAQAMTITVCGYETAT
jgi:hypothetical protein